MHHAFDRQVDDDLTGFQGGNCGAMSGQRGRGTSGAHRHGRGLCCCRQYEVMKDGTQPMTGEFREVNTDRTALAFGDDTDRCAPFHTAQAEHPGERINPLAFNPVGQHRFTWCSLDRRRRMIPASINGRQP